MQSDSGLQYSNGSSDGFDTLFQQLGGADTVLKSSTQDIWGNVRIPVLQLLPSFDPNDTNKWVSVPHQEQLISYESLIGIPFRISSLNGGNASFSINSTYFRFDVRLYKSVSRQRLLTTSAVPIQYGRDRRRHSQRQCIHRAASSPQPHWREHNKSWANFIQR